MKYHLGCGTKRLEGFVNIDAVMNKSVDIIDNIAILETQEDNTADLIYACHCLEHFGRHEVLKVLEQWNKKLKPGGKIRIAVPDFDAVVNIYQINKDVNQVLGLVCGGQRNEYDYHKMIFTFESLSNLLSLSGFINIRRYDWRETEHSSVDDYSQSYIPHMQKETGLLMSLNVEAIKNPN